MCLCGIRLCLYVVFMVVCGVWMVLILDIKPLGIVFMMLNMGTNLCWYLIYCSI